MKLTSKNFKFLLNITNPLYTKTPLFNSFQLKSFSHGPYNPLNYKSNAIHEKKVTTEEAYFLAKKYKEFGELPMYSMRHVHAMRQSGPIPPFAGPYTMEDIRNAEASQAVSVEEFNEKVSAEEMMRRVPGLTKKEAVKIQSLNLNPLQQLDYAYIVVNNGIDVFFDPGNGYLMRQVVTK